jgi:site-specific DNA recombinase
MLTKAGLYCRISKDDAGQGLGVGRQEEDHRAKCASLGWGVASVYVDNDISADGNHKRPDYEQMLEDLRSGTITAVVVTEVSRLQRGHKAEADL